MSTAVRDCLAARGPAHSIVPTRPPTRLVRTVTILWRRRVVRGIDYPGVRARVNEDDGLTGRYALMTLLSAGIAVLGLLLSSPAVVIGAMLISPLMGPILGLGFALAASDLREIRQSAVALAAGTLLAVGFCALVVLASPLKAVTPEILARTRPNLFDLLVAIFAALAGTYAIIRARGGTIVGVAIATALMPPLAVIGYGLATTNMAIFIGASELFMTNAVAIALTAATVAKLYGFGTDLAHPSTRMQTLILLAVLVALAVPLGFALRSIAWESRATSQVRAYLDLYFGKDARVTQLDVDFNTTPLVVRAVVLTDHYRAPARDAVDKALSHALARPVEVRLNQVVFNRGDPASTQALAALEASRDFAANGAAVMQRSEADTIAAELDARGVSADAITIDPVRLHVIAQAPAQPQTTLSGWFDAERELAAAHPAWTIALTPPASPLPLVAFTPGTPALGPDADATLDVIAWALGRWHAVTVAVIGRAASGDDGTGSARALAAARADAVVAALAKRGVAATARTDPVGPRQRAAEREQGRALFRSVEIATPGAPPRLP